jgi:hypothetical protein
MRVMVIVKGDQDYENGAMPDVELLNAMGKYNEELVKAGIMVSGEGLHPTSKAKRVHFSGDKRTVTDGPFTESKEMIAGFWIWQVDSMEQAVEWLKRAPNPTGIESHVDIRPVFEVEDFGDAATPEVVEREERLRKQLEEQQKKA